MSDKELINIAMHAMNNAYAPYSQRKVGAALLCDDGSIFAGCNIENISKGITICAERSAIASAISNGKKNFNKVAIICDQGYYCRPCLLCQQAFSEFVEDIIILCANKYKEYIILNLEKMLPRKFAVVTDIKTTFCHRANLNMWCRED